MSTIQHNPKNDLYMFLTFLFIIIAFMVLLNSCEASNKAHWNKVHPYGGWAGRNYIHGIDSVKTMVKK